MILVLGKVRGYAVFALVVGIAGVVSWYASGVRADVPLADGPRVVRQFIVGFMPSLGAPLLVDRTPTLSASLARTRTVRCADVGLYWTGIAMALVPGWVGVTTQTVHYEMLITLILCNCVIAISAWFGEYGALVGAILGLVWILFGGAAAVVLGFPGVAWDPFDPILASSLYVPMETVALVLCSAGLMVAYCNLKPRFTDIAS